MKAVGAFEAKTHFSQLLAEVMNGEKITIMKHGRKIAMLVPIDTPEAKENPAVAAIKAIRILRKGVTLGKALSIKALKEEGRR